jgi:hypothetical protein
MPLGVFGSIMGSFSVIVAVHKGTSSMVTAPPAADSPVQDTVEPVGGTFDEHSRPEAFGVTAV